MNDNQALDEEVEKKFNRQDEKKKRKMKVSGKKVFDLKKIITKKQKSDKNT